MEGNSNQSKENLKKKSVSSSSNILLHKNKAGEPIIEIKKEQAEKVNFPLPTSPSVTKTYQKKPSSNDATKAEGYEVRIMKHDMDESKGKEIKSFNISKDILKTDKSKPERTNLESISKPNVPIDQFLRPKEGTIGKPEEIKEKKQEKQSLIKKIKYYFAQKRLNRADKKKKTMLIVVLVAIVSIGAAGYYFYVSGVFSSLDGIFQTFFERDDSITPPLATTTQSTEGTITSTVPVVPIDLSTTTIPSIGTTTPILPIDPPIDDPSIDPPIDDPSIDPIIQAGFIPSDPFFKSNSREVVHVENLDETFDELKIKFENTEVDSNQFKRIIITTEDNFSGISLAQIWRGIRSLAIKSDDEIEHAELLSSEIIDGLGLAMPNNIYGSISEDYNLFFYGQPSGESRVVLIFKLTNSDIEDHMISWESTMIYDLENLFLGQSHGEPATENYQDNFYKNIHIRYLNLPEPSLTMDHAVVISQDYLILTTSREAAWATVDKLLENNTDLPKNNTFKTDEIIEKYNDLLMRQFEEGLTVSKVNNVEFTWYEEDVDGDLISTRIQGQGLDITHTYDPVVSEIIEDFFKVNEFKKDSYNSGESMLTGSFGYKKENVVCLEVFGMSDPDYLGEGETYFRKLYCGEILLLEELEIIG